jgi:hypothetical protein
LEDAVPVHNAAAIKNNNQATTFMVSDKETLISILRDWV